MKSLSISFGVHILITAVVAVIGLPPLWGKTLYAPLFGFQKDTGLNGTWRLFAASWCGRELPFTEEEKAQTIWTFSGNKFSHITEIRHPPSAGQFSVDLQASPKHLDLRYTKGDVLATRKCIFQIQGEKLTIALTEPFLPGTAAQELANAKAAFEKRPKAFQPDQKDINDSTAVYVFVRREEKAAMRWVGTMPTR